jgi:pimeloyl-ACP methyl ester carboxylesterase
MIHQPIESIGPPANDATTPAATQILGEEFAVAFSHHTAKVNGIEMHYVRGGQGVPVVFLHGYPQTWYAWRKIMPAIAKHYTVICPDLRGYGDTSKPKTGYDSQTMAEDVHQLLDELGYNSYFLVAHDMGGPVAYALAAAHSEKVLKLVCLDTAAPGSYQPLMDITHGGLWHFAFFMEPTFPEMLTAGKEEEFLTAFAYKGHLVHVQDAISDIDIGEYLRSYASPGGMHSGFECYRALPEDIRQNEQAFGGAKLPMPVMAIGGDKGFGDWAFKAMQQVATNVQKAIIPDCGHFIAEEQPEKLAEVLLTFFEKKKVQSPSDGARIRVVQPPSGGARINEQQPAPGAVRISANIKGITFIQTWIFSNAENQRQWLGTMKENIDILRTKPGFGTMVLHPSLDGLQSIVYAQWESEELMKAAVSDRKAIGAHAAMVHWSVSEPIGNVYLTDSLLMPLKV